MFLFVQSVAVFRKTAFTVIFPAEFFNYFRIILSENRYNLPFALDQNATWLTHLTNMFVLASNGYYRHSKHLLGSSQLSFGDFGIFVAKET